MRLIDADDIHYCMYDLDNYFSFYAVTDDEIAEMPTIDAAPVVHAKWITEFDDRGWKKHSCSGCGYFRRTDIHVSLNWYYCPHCGAKMDLEGNL